MFFAILLTVLPTLFAWTVLRKIHFLKSSFLRITIAWFLGQYILTLLTFLLALLLSSQTSPVLPVATIFSLMLLTLFFFSVYPQAVKAALKHIFSQAKAAVSHPSRSLFLVVFCFFFSYMFFHPQLEMRDTTIYTSPVYWDFHWHMALVQNFVYGDNFPPQNESFSGFPQTYHFFWGVVVAMYESLGMSLVSALNYVSITSFFFLLLGIIGFAEEFFHSRRAGTIAVLLALTSSSLRFTAYFQSLNPHSFLSFIKGLLTNTQHPFYFSFMPGNPFGYNGTMFNLFYLLAERQMIFAIIFLFVYAWFIANRKHIASLLLLTVGALFGFYFLWHIFTAILVLCSLLFLLILAQEKRKTLFFLIGYGIVFFLHYLYFKSLTASPWFYPDITRYPKFNPAFSTFEDTFTFSLLHMLGYYIYAYGFKLLLLPAGLWLLWKKKKQLSILLCSIIIPAFLLVNTVQLSPTSIYDNHKWLRPMNFFADLTVAFFLAAVFFASQKMKYRFLGIFLVFLITLSGFIELPPFLNSRPNLPFLRVDTPLIQFIRVQTPPRSAFIGDDTAEIQFAGRKLFLGDYTGSDLRLNKAKREEIIKTVQKTTSISHFCNVTKRYNIDYIESNNPESKPAILAHLPHNAHILLGNEYNMPSLLIDVKRGCQKI